MYTRAFYLYKKHLYKHYIKCAKVIKKTKFANASMVGHNIIMFLLKITIFQMCKDIIGIVIIIVFLSNNNGRIIIRFRANIRFWSNTYNQLSVILWRFYIINSYLFKYYKIWNFVYFSHQIKMCHEYIVI